MGTPFTLASNLQALSAVRGDWRDGFGTSANTDFAGTLTFATDRPVMDLPPGYTLNSVQAGIVDNHFTVPVPEPGTVGVMALGVIGLLGRGRGEPRVGALPTR